MPQSLPVVSMAWCAVGGHRLGNSLKVDVANTSFQSEIEI